MPSRRRHARMLWSALLVWAAAILWLSSLTPNELPDAAFVFWDKVNHFAAFTVGGWLAAGALRNTRPEWARPRTAILAVAIIAAFGFFDEMLQTLTPGRTGGDVFDWVSDVLGAVTGTLLIMSSHRLSFRRNFKERR